MTIDVFGLVPGDAAAPRPAREVGGGEPRLSTTFAAGEESMSFGAAPFFVAPPAEVVAPLDKVDAAVRRGDSARLEVVVRTRKVGHFFPGGTVDAFDVWVELEVVDSNGKTILHSGFLDDPRLPDRPGAGVSDRKGASGPVERGRTSTAACSSTSTAT